MKKVMVFGTFDLLHPGHIHMLEEAKTYGDFLVVVIARDTNVKEFKGKFPVYRETVRLENMQKLGIADKVVLGNKEDKFAIIHKEAPDVLAFGYDQKIPISNLKKKLAHHVQLIRLTPFKPEIYKSSKLTNHLVVI